MFQLKNIFLACLLFSVSNCLAQSFPYCIDSKFSEQNYFTDLSLNHQVDVQYAQNTDYLGNIQSLKLDIHYPNLLIDALPKRPMVVWIHGGGFENGDKSDMTDYCNKLARAGYVAVSINYRLGWDHIGACNGNAEKWKLAMYRAIQDAHAAIRYMVSNAATYRIDVDNIFLAGQSEGGTTAINLAYMNQTEANVLIPAGIADLGAINNAGNILLDTFNIKAVFNWCGASIDTNIFQNDTPIPLLSIHGLLDSIMPVEFGNYMNCANYSILFGPKSIYNRMKNIGICSEANFDANGEHCYFPSLEKDNYIPAKYTCFFKNILCGNCTTESKLSYNQKPCSEAAPVSINDIHSPNDFLIYPNPTNDYFYLKSSNKNIENMSGSIQDMTGKIILDLSFNINKQNIENHKFILPKNLAKGVYFLNIKMNNKAFIQKLIIE